MKSLKMLVLTLLAFSTSAHAAGAYLASNATVTDVVNTSSNGQNFAVKTEGGSSICSGQWAVGSGQWVVFPEADAANPNMH